MSRCPKLDYESGSFFGTTNDKYICTVIGKRMDVDDPKVKHVCKSDYDDEYRNCEIYKDTR